MPVIASGRVCVLCGAPTHGGHATYAVLCRECAPFDVVLLAWTSFPGERGLDVEQLIHHVRRQVGL